MKRKLSFTILLLCTLSLVHAQTIEELYKKRQYKELIQFANKTDELNKQELYYIGYAFFQLNEDKKAIALYDKAIAKGLDNGHIYLYKGLAQFYDKQYDQATISYRTAINRNPKRQKCYTELGNLFYYQELYDSALVYFHKAREQTFEHGDPYFKLPNTYHLQNKFKKALQEYYKSASLINKEDSDYVKILQSIGLLEYAHTKNYIKSIEAYKEVLSILPKRYDLYTKLVKAYYANKQYSQGDSIFNILKVQYSAKNLPKNMQQLKGATVDEFWWKGQRISAMKYYKKPSKFSEPIYKLFLINKEGTKVEKKFLTEKTGVEIDGMKHLLCGIDKATGAHSTYPVG